MHIWSGRGQAGYLGDGVVDVETHAGGDRVPAAGEQPAERARHQPRRVGADRLRVVVTGERDDLPLDQTRVTELHDGPGT